MEMKRKASVDSSSSGSSEQAKLPKAESAKVDDFTVSGRNQLVLVDRRVNLLTPIQPHNSDHSYNGVVAIVCCKGPEAIRVHGFGIGGTLGPVSVFVHKKPNTQINVTPSPDVWQLLLNKNITPPINRQQLAYVRFEEPVQIDPGEERGFYVHVAVFHDDGISYQSFQPGTTIIEDHRMQLKVGAGRCGERPFLGGWWRGGRGLSGSVLYEAMRKIWSPKTHKEFPASFQNIIIKLLVLWYREETIFHLLPLECMYVVFEQLEHDWFENLTPEVAVLNANNEEDGEELEEDDSGDYFDGRYRYWQL
jgi:hypothetical protein